MDNKIKNVLILFSLLASGCPMQALADIAVIVHPKNDAPLTLDDIKNIFMGRKFEFPKSGIEVKPVDQQEKLPIRNEFYEKLAQKDETRMKAYWANLIFTGTASPPKELTSDAEVRNFVKNNVSGIGYIDDKSVDSSVKVVQTLK